MRSLTNYAPSTFEERGAAVPFTSPTLAQTRVRREERGGLEVLIPNLSEGRGVYVVGWASLPLAFPMTVHDRFLHETIVTTGGCSPEDIRKAALETARTGLAGPLAADAAAAALADEAEQRLLINFQLITEVLRAVGLESADILRAGLASEEGRELTRGYMVKAARRLGIEPKELYLRVAEIAAFMEPIGLAASPRPARLRRLMRGLAGVRDGLTGWATGNVSEAAPIAGFCAEVAEHTLNHARGVAERLDGWIERFEALLRGWEERRADMRRACVRLAWLLDGWDFLIATWEQAHAQGRAEQEMAVNDIFRVLPLLPKNEDRMDMAGTADRVMAANRRSVRAYVDWRSGQLDADLVARIEAVKGRAA